ncbi:thioredoxin domain-containing protein [Desulfogranum japonicum]|uniref:thioredoxin domain-containing protein n=1 Tax=Desulfogranum japonicum TaxID=231447 RepID=UPI000428805D|nr:thioredoxin domain-containing protein [Desulfogranum japonicum]
MTELQNRLRDELSPYLQQHSGNPVHWFPWCEEALEKARAEDKPIFLSIGYSTCHWCHVMAREVFTNKEAADKLNQWFVSVKVDREERPDIDQLYMSATMAMTGSGGWPLSLFLFPDGQPFFCATYIPLNSNLHSIGFLDVLEAIHESWLKNRDELTDTAKKTVRIIRRVRQLPSALSPEELAGKCFHILQKAYDRKRGGFGPAPKFPRPSVFDFLMNYAAVSGDSTAQSMVTKTLTAMAEGGIYDQLAGGFHRYSVDAEWRTPHFEKMLYDQAQLIETYSMVYERTGEPLYSNVIRETIGYLFTTLKSSCPLFYSAEDADSPDPYQEDGHGEGLYYLWTEEEIIQILGRDVATLFTYHYGIEFDGNLTVDPRKEFTGRNILYCKHPLADTARRHNLSETETIHMLTEAKQRLLATRKMRIRPHCDTKIITSWNCMLVRALAKAGRALDNEEYVLQADAMLTFLWNNLRNDGAYQLFRLYDVRKGKKQGKGQLDDYVHMTSASIALYTITKKKQYLEQAVNLTQEQLAVFWDDGQQCFYDSAPDTTLLMRTYAEQDGAEPAANSVAADNLMQLTTLTQDGSYARVAKKVISSFAGKMESYPAAMPLLVRVLHGASDTQQI